MSTVDLARAERRIPIRGGGFVAAGWKACPKCGSAAVFTSDGPGVGWDVNLRLMLKNGMTPDQGWTSYLCADCGFFENYVTNEDWLGAIRNDPASNGWRPLSGT